MALRKPETAQFEAEETTVVEAETVVEAKEAGQPTVVEAKEAGQPTAEDTVKVEAVKAIATAQNTAVAKATPFKAAFKEMENAIDPGVMDFDTFPRVTVGLGGFEDDAKKDLGKTIKLRLMSWNLRYVASPGIMDDDSTEDVRYSLDGKTIDETGEDLAAYVQKLRDVDGYANAAVKKYMNLYGFITEENGKEVPDEDQRIVSVQVPPRSVAKFAGFQVEAGMKMSKGSIEETADIRLTQEKRQGKSVAYAGILFTL
jgi:hypothetical protein